MFGIKTDGGKEEQGNTPVPNKLSTQHKKQTKEIEVHPNGKKD